ncbi:hypothetical protein [Lachnoclostridium phytofermentans]|uniref:hypothetical protein n=2 Tax=Lachnoclostridium phytofermentans TaxID=66219 RepID=UPI000497BAFD|nr:hypothetical protein [Lachnoclostridium phytofermentans]
MELQCDKQTKDKKEKNRERWNFVTSTKQGKRLIFESMQPYSMEVFYPKSCSLNQSKIPCICFLSETKKGTEEGIKNYASLAQFAERGYFVVILHKESSFHDMESMNQCLFSVKEYFKDNKKYSCDIERMVIWMDQIPREVPDSITCSAFVAYHDNQNDAEVSTKLIEIGKDSSKVLCLSGGDGLWSDDIFNIVEDYIVSYFE